MNRPRLRVRAVLCSAALIAALGLTVAPARLEAATSADLLAPTSVDISQAESAAQRDFDLLPAMPPVAPGRVTTIRLIAEVKPWTIAPGVTVQAWTYNGTVPGPTIHVRQGDRVRVILTNHLPEPTTIHWHGLELPAAMDGVPGMSQDAVMPGQSFVYEFTATDPGTYIYHTHYDDLVQLDRGLYGAFIVDPLKPSKERYDRNYLMLLSSWRVYSNAENYFSIDGKSYPLTKPLIVNSGDRVRIRMINISGTEFHTMHIHGHHFQVVAVDGQNVAPSQRQTMVTVTVGPGETRDLAFLANAQPGTWMFHCHVLDHMMNGAVGPGGLITAVQYANAPSKLTSMASADSMSATPGGGEGGLGPGGPPLDQVATIVLGAIAGLTIFFGLPFAAMKHVPAKGMAFLNATAIGVLFFLLFDILRQAGDPIENALNATHTGASALPFAGLVTTYIAGLAIGVVGLVVLSRVLLRRYRATGGDIPPMALATTIALGIGSHNFSEGLAIGQSAATGAVQLAVMLIIGFGLHNMTEGFGIAAPLAGRAPTGLWQIVRLGLIGGAPTFLGTIVGYHFTSTVMSVAFLTVAAGAIMWVIGEMTNAGRRIGYKELAAIGLFAGFVLGFGTDLILASAGA